MSTEAVIETHKACESTKLCTRCQLTKPLDSFSRGGTAADGRASHCKACRAEYARLVKSGELPPRKTAAKPAPVRDRFIVEDADGGLAIVRNDRTGEEFLVEWDGERRRWVCSACTPRRGDACAHVLVYTRTLPLDVVRALSKTLTGSKQPHSAAPNAEETAARAERIALRKAEGEARREAVLAARDAEEQKLRAARAQSWSRRVEGTRPQKKVAVGPFGVVDTRAQDVQWRGPQH